MCRAIHRNLPHRCYSLFVFPITMISSQGQASKKIVDETVRLYRIILASPPTEKQLARPAFKCIQDIVKCLIKETRTLRDVFNPSDFDTGKKVWNKRMQTEFVQRLLDHTAKNGQQVVGCVAAKVVAGLEPNKTNELLQALARLAQARLGSLDATDARPRTFTRSSVIPTTSQSSNPSGKQQNLSSRQTSTKTSTVLSGGRRSSKNDTVVSSKLSSAGKGSERTKKAPLESPLETVAQPISDRGYVESSDAEPSGMRDELSANKSESPSDISKQPMVLMTSEDYIGKHVAQLRVTLKELRDTLSDASRLDKQLRRKVMKLQPS